MQALLRTQADCRLDPRALAVFRADCADLRKYTVLNYIAVIKSCKKRNRQLAAGLAKLGVLVPPLRAVELLSQQYFFTSPILASLSTEAEILLKVNFFHFGIIMETYANFAVWCL